MLLGSIAAASVFNQCIVFHINAYTYFRFHSLTQTLSLSSNLFRAQLSSVAGGGNSEHLNFAMRPLNLCCKPPPPPLHIKMRNRSKYVFFPSPPATAAAIIIYEYTNTSFGVATIVLVTIVLPTIVPATLLPATIALATIVLVTIGLPTIVPATLLPATIALATIVLATSIPMQST